VNYSEFDWTLDNIDGFCPLSGCFRKPFTIESLLTSGSCHLHDLQCVLDWTVCIML